MSRGGDAGMRPAAELVREGEYWTFTFEGREVRVRDSKGVGYLAELLANPGAEMSALSLVGHGVAMPDSDAGPMLDRQAKHEYRARLAGLQREIEEAERFHDTGRAARARLEYEAIARELGAATGLGGRDRRTGSPAERARLNVTRAVKSAVGRVAEFDEGLGEHLLATVHTGQVCAYRPDPAAAPAWRVRTRRARPQPRLFHPPKTQYARSGEVSIAYQVLGEGPIDLVWVPGWASHLDFQWTSPELTRFLREVASFSRLIMFDKRGVGLSDPVGAAPTVEERMDDIRAVMDAAGSEQAAIYATSEGTAIAALFAATYPGRVRGLILYGAFAAGPGVANLPGGAGLRDAMARCRAAADGAWGEGHTLDIFAPNMAQNKVLRRGWGMFERASMSPAMARALLDWEQTLDVRAALPAIGAPTLVLNRRGDVATPIEGGRYVAEQIPGARFLELPGDDHAPIGGDLESHLQAMKDFLADLPDPEPRRLLGTVLRLERRPTPSHTGTAAEPTRAQIARAGGDVVADAPSGLTVLFDRPIRAIGCALDLLATPHAQQCELRAGLHVGECELGSSASEGVTVAVATALARAATAGELLASQTVRDLVMGSGIGFAAHGSHQPPGTSEQLAVYTVQPSAGPAFPVPAADAHPPVLERMAHQVVRHAPGSVRAAARITRPRN